VYYVRHKDPASLFKEFPLIGVYDFGGVSFLEDSFSERSAEYIASILKHEPSCVYFQRDKPLILKAIQSTPAVAAPLVRYSKPYLSGIISYMESDLPIGDFVEEVFRN
jgi:hypothetical protein